MTIKKLFPYLFLLLSLITYGQNERLKEISLELSKILPELVGTYDDLGNPILKTGDAWDEILKTAKEYTNELRQQEIYQKAQSDLLSLQIAQAGKEKAEKGRAIFERSASEDYIESFLEEEKIYKDTIAMSFLISKTK